MARKSEQEFVESSYKKICESAGAYVMKKYKVAQAGGEPFTYKDYIKLRGEVDPREFCDHECQVCGNEKCPEFPK